MPCLVEDVPNYCHYAKTNAHWESIAERAGNNPDVINLYSLRKDLCKPVEEGEFIVEQATIIFEKERDRVLGKLMLDAA